MRLMAAASDGPWQIICAKVIKVMMTRWPFGSLSEPSAVELRCVTTDLGAKLIGEEVDVVSLSTTGFEQMTTTKF